jgi:phage/plasmid-associated DNA primase
MSLKDARFAYGSESAAGDALRSEDIKSVTSDMQTGNEKFKTQENFEVNARFIMASNYAPRITGTDYGIWRRLLYYHCKRRFLDPKEIDPKNPYHHKRETKFLELWTSDVRYQQAFLSIMVKYYQIYRYQYNGDMNKIPKNTIDKETQEFRYEQDTLARFLKENVVFVGTHDPVDDSPITDIPLSELAQLYINWYSKNIDNTPHIRKEVIKSLRECHLKKHIVNKTHGGIVLQKHRVLGVGETPDIESSENDTLLEPEVKVKKQKQKNKIISDFEEDSEINKIDKIDEIDEIDEDKETNALYTEALYEEVYNKV